MRVVATVALSNFPLWKECLGNLHTFCDEVYIQFDQWNGRQEDLLFLRNEGRAFFNGKLKKVIPRERPWGVGAWHEDLLRLLDTIKPDAVLYPCHDESFSPRFHVDLRRFLYGPKPALMFDFTMMTDDGRHVEPYPALPHMRAFKWRPGLSFYPYHGRGQAFPYVTEETQMKARNKIRHWCFYTKQMEREKKRW